MTPPTPTTPRTSPAEASRLLASEHPEIARMVELFGPVSMGRKPRVDERFTRLARSIAGQQLSTTAARTIFGRVVDLVGELSPSAVLATSPEDLRSCGLSGAKVNALVDLAARVDDGSLDLGALGRMSEERIETELVKVKGIGRWTAQMFLLGSLQKLDVWPTGDAGVRNGFALIAALPKTPTADELEPLGDKYRPYRSVAAWYCWRYLDNNPDA